MWLFVNRSTDGPEDEDRGEESRKSAGEDGKRDGCMNFWPGPCYQAEGQPCTNCRVLDAFFGRRHGCSKGLAVARHSPEESSSLR